MNNENEEKKKKKFLVPIIIGAAVLLLGGAAAVLALTGVFKPKAPEQEETFSDYQLFWNVDREAHAGKSLIGTSDRVVDPKDGYYHILFATDGRQVTRRIAEKRVVDQIDANDLMGLEFNEKGIVVNIRRIEEISQGYDVSGLYVQEVLEDGSIRFNTSSNMTGRDKVMKMPEGLRIFDVCGQDASRFIGQEVAIKDLTPGDRIFTVINLDGTITNGFITHRNVMPKIYWNITRKWNAELLSTTREPNAEGVYEIPMALNGEQVIVKAKDKKMVDAIDKIPAKNCYLEFDTEGYVSKVVYGSTATGGGSYASWYIVTEVDFDARTIISEKRDSTTGQVEYVEGELSKDLQIFDVSGMGEFVGVEVDSCKPGDQIHGLKTEDGKIRILYIVSRCTDLPVYWNVERQYDSTLMKTKRTPDANGYYHFIMAAEGKQVELRTNDIDIANNIDSRANKNMGLILEGDIIKTVYEATKTRNTGGSTAASWADVTRIYSATSFHTLKDPNSTAAKAGEQLDLTLAPGAEIYNVSANYDNFVGERTTIRLNDTVHCITNRKGEVYVAFVVTRPLDLPISWNITRKYDSTNNTTTRKPEADGYYHFDIATDGQLLNLRTKDKKIADFIDSNANHCCALKLNGDVIVKAVTGGNVLAGKGGTAASWAYVTEVKSATQFHTLNKSTTGAKAGEQLDLTLAPNAKVVNPTQTVKDHVGELTTLQVGDQIHCWLNKDKQVTYAFIVSRKMKKVCPVCEKEVEWAPYNGSFTYEDTPTHFFFASDRTPNGSMGTTKAGEIHLDLNGFSINAAEGYRAFGMADSSTVYIMDLSGKGTSKIVANGGQKPNSGGTPQNGSLISASYTRNKLYLKDITIDGSKSNQPGALGLIYGGSKGTISLENCKVIGGIEKNGSAIYAKGNLILKNTTITGGTASEGGSVTIVDMGALTVEGNTTVSGGKQTDGTNANIYFYEGRKMTAGATGITSGAGSLPIRTEANGIFTEADFAKYMDKVKSDLEGGTISVATGDALQIQYEISGIEFVNKSQSIVAGTPTALEVKMIPVMLPGTKILFESSDPTVATVDENGLIIGAKESATPVTITAKTADGAFTTTCEVTVTPATNTEHMHAEATNAQIHAGEGTKISYTAWTDSTTLPTDSGYYYLTEDVHLNARQPSLPAGQNLHLCLNGHTIDNIYDDNTQTLCFYNEGCTMAITDCSDGETGKFVSNGSCDRAPGRTIWVRYGTLKIYGGTFIGSENITETGGGCITVSYGSTFEMYGGTLQGGTASKTADGKGGNGGTLSNLGTAIIKGGTIKDGTAAASGGCIYNGSSGVLTIDGPVAITGGVATERGGNIYNLNKMTVDGATITDGNATIVGGNIYIKGTGTVKDSTVTGGKIAGGISSGANIHVAANATIDNVTFGGSEKADTTGNNLHINASGGTITVKDLDLEEGGFLIQNATNVTLTGTVKVGKEGCTKGMFITNNSSMKQVVTAKDLSKDSLIYVAYSNVGARIVDGAENLDNFKTVNTEHEFVVDPEKTSDIISRIHVALHKHCDCGGTIETETELGGGLTHTCDEKVEWTAWGSTSALPCYSDLKVGENYFYLTDDVTLTSNWRPGKNGSNFESDMAGRNIHLCLNGHNIYAKGINTILSTLGASSAHTQNVKVTLTDCAEEPGMLQMTPADKETGTSALVWLNGSNAELNVYNITLDGNGMKAKRNGALVAISKSTATFNFFSGTLMNANALLNGTTVVHGGLVYVESGAFFNMYGGTMKNGTVTGNSENGNGGCLAVVGTANIYGGEISGGKAEQGGNIYLSGDSGKLTIDGDVVIKDGEAKRGRGGNIFAKSSKSNGLYVKGATIEGGKTGSFVGGNICTQAMTASFIDCTVKNGTATANSGGNINIGGGTTVTIKGCTFTGGKDKSGTANELHLNASGITVTFEDTRIEGSCMIQGAKAVTMKGKMYIANPKNSGGASDGFKVMSNTASYLQFFTVENLSADSVIWTSANKSGTLVKGGAAYADVFHSVSTVGTLSTTGADLKYTLK